MCILFYYCFSAYKIILALIKFREQLEIKSETMLEYARVILPKVSFSRELFRKELMKCIGWVENSELMKLKEWCFENFRDQYPDILTEAFEKKAA